MLNISLFPDTIERFTQNQNINFLGISLTL